jgi:hypothetical protein
MRKGTLLSLWLAIVLVASGCTSAKPMMVPSGAQGYRIWCELPSQCYDRAAVTCPNGYDIEANEKNYLGLGDVDGNLFITCRQSGKQPVAAVGQAAAEANVSAPAAHGTSSGWWSNQRQERPVEARYKCTDADGKPYVTATPTRGCTVE